MLNGLPKEQIQEKKPKSRVIQNSSELLLTSSQMKEKLVEAEKDKKVKTKKKSNQLKPEKQKTTNPGIQNNKISKYFTKNPD